MLWIFDWMPGVFKIAPHENIIQDKQQAQHKIKHLAEEMQSTVRGGLTFWKDNQNDHRDSCQEDA